MTARLSLVIPAHNEEGAIAVLLREAFAVLPETLLAEVIVVDDASTDATAATVSALLPTMPRLRLLRHARNAGKSAAIRSGVLAARSRLVATMDGDGQNPPAEVARLHAAWSADGARLVGGLRAKRQDTVSKRWASRLANAVRRSLMRDDCPDSVCGLKVFGREDYLRLPFFHNQHRFLPALFRAEGLGTAFLPIEDRPRLHGRSKYTNWGRLVEGIPDLLGVVWLIRRARVVTASEERP